MTKAIGLIGAMTAATAMAAGTTSGVAQAQAPVPAATGAPIVTLSVSEQVNAAPDIARIGTGVQTRAMTAKEAMAQNAAQMDRLIKALSDAGVARRDIQTSSINLNPRYEFAPSPDGSGSTQRFMGYEAFNRLSVTIRKVSDAGPMIDRLVGAGATNIDGPSFDIANPAPLIEKARNAAMASAKARAMSYARAAGYRTVRLVSITEGGGMGPVPMQMMAMAEGKAATPVEPGQISTGIVLTVQYAME